MTYFDLVDYEIEALRWRVENPGRAGKGQDPLFGDDGGEEVELEVRMPRGAWRELLGRVGG